MLQFETKSTAAVSALAFSPDGMRLLVGYAKGGVQEWDAFGELLCPITEQGDLSCSCVAWAPSGTNYVYTTKETWTIAFDRPGFPDSKALGGETPVTRLETPISGFDYLTEGIVVIGQGHPTEQTTGAVSLRDVTLSKIEESSQSPTIYESSGVRGIAIHRESRLVVWITGHLQLKLWRVDRPDQHTIPLKKTATRVVLSPDGSIVAVAIDWAILTFDVQKRMPLKEFTGHKGKVTSLAFSPDSRRIVTGSWDETVREWDVASGKELKSMSWKIGKISSLSYAPDGTRIAAGSTAGKVIIWDVD